MPNTPLWSCTHIPNIIDLSGKTKKLSSDKLRWEEAEEAKEKIRLKQYVSLRSKGRHNNPRSEWQKGLHPKEDVLVRMGIIIKD